MKLISLKNKRLFSFVMLMGYVIILKMYYFNCPSRATITAVHSDESRSHDVINDQYSTGKYCACVLNHIWEHV